LIGVPGGGVGDLHRALFLILGEGLRNSEEAGGRRVSLI